MKIYFACPTGLRRDSIVEEYGDKFGACLTRDIFNNVTANMMPWFLDNGAFADWKDGKDVDRLTIKFLRRLERVSEAIAKGELTAPDFIVVPDIVGGGGDSLLFSRSWIHSWREEFPQFKYYLAAQDGMRFYHDQDGTRSPYCIEVPLFSGTYDGLFIGGTKQWKYQHGEELVKLAHKYGKPCHIGGIGNRRSILWGKMINADSCDSGVAMIHSKHLKEVLQMDSELLWSA